nr:outer membrane porin, OprD family [Candidatus Sulfurimonas ponti]
VSVVDKFKKMFTEGKVTGQMRSIYAGYKQEETGAVDTYATAIGGILKYELASLNGFNAGAAFIISHDIDFATGNGAKQDPELSSDKGNYSELSEAYINYKNGGFNLRVGRQLFDTPLADSDDVRMVPNTFEAYLATYKVSHFTFTAGNVQRWQGAGAGLGYDNGVSLESEWIDIGGQGTFFGGVTYQDDWEVNVWYYDIPHLINATKATYIDINSHTYNGALAVHGSLQYLHESESKNSGVDAEIFGALFEIEMHGLGFNLAYNASKKHKGKKSFSGIGGGSMFTSMDTMIIDEITEDREAQAIVGGLVYAVDNWNFIYAYGDFDGKENSAGVKAHIVEQNIGFEYSVNDEFVLAAIFVSQEDKENGAKTANDWDRTQIMLKYDF